ncbi:MAG: ankyrin repeat domain-containing protein [Bacteroidia bacterium]|nr:ankyrin repeat domain-containing protein [Bacteroidia bacterium]
MSRFQISFILIILCSFLISVGSLAQSLDEKLRQAYMVKDYVKIEKAIKKNKIDLNGKAGNELLLLACKDGNETILNMMINEGASLNSEDNVGRTPMMAAVAYDQTKTIELLQSNGAEKERPITQRDYDCMAHDKLEKGMTYREVEKLIGSLGKSMVDVMAEHQFEIKISHLEKYRFVNGVLSFWKHPCKTSKQQLGN